MERPMLNLSMNESYAGPPQRQSGIRLPPIRHLLHDPPAQHSRYGHNHHADLYADRVGYATEPLSIRTQQGQYSPPTSATSSPCDTPRSSDASGSDSSGSRQSSMGPSSTATMRPAGPQRSKRGSESQEAGTNRSAKRSAANPSGTKKVTKTQNEKAHRKEQKDIHALGEDFLESVFGYEVPKAQSASNSKKSDITGDKYQNMLASHVVEANAVQTVILMKAKYEGPGAIKDYIRETCELLDRELLKDEQGLPCESWMRDDSGHDPGACCEDVRTQGKCNHDDHARIDSRKECRSRNWTRNLERALGKFEAVFRNDRSWITPGFRRFERSQRLQHR